MGAPPYYHRATGRSLIVDQDVLGFSEQDGMSIEDGFQEYALGHKPRCHPHLIKFKTHHPNHLCCSLQTRTSSRTVAVGYKAVPMLRRLLFRHERTLYRLSLSERNDWSNPDTYLSHEHCVQRLH